jgi:hypothetical protein
MGIVGPLLVEVHCRVTGVVRRRAVAGLLVFGSEALHRCPGLDQGAVDGEVLAAHQAQRVRLLQHPVEELAGHVVLQQTLPVLGERRVIEARLDGVHVEEP